MNRFTLAFAAGSLLLCGSQILLNLGLHPEHPASIPVLGEGILGLVLGTALVVSGLLGLVEGYQKAATRVRLLLQDPHLDRETSAQTLSELQEQQRSFWRDYRRSALGLLLFLAGLLGLGALLSHTSYLLYLVAIGSGIFSLGSVSLGLMVQGVRALRRHWQSIEQTAVAIQAQPSALPTAPIRALPRWTVYSKDERLRHFRRHSTLPTPP